MAEAIANFINADKNIKGIQIGDHEIEIKHFTDNTTIFLRDIICLNRIHVILRLSVKPTQRQFFKMPSLLWCGAYKNGIHQPGRLE